jgi:adenylosuccinate synthase
MYFPIKKLQIEKVFGQKTDLTVEKIYREYIGYGRRLKKYLGDVSEEIDKEINNKVLFEGAHGTFLDGIFGTYPFTTAVYTVSGGVFPYVGIPPQKIYSIGIVKAYTTRVGNGPFPTELKNQTGDKIREAGGEFGTVSKRPRRCGWLDLPLVRTATRLSGFDYLAITKLDVLSVVDRIKICVGYKIGNKVVNEVPPLIAEFDKCRPVYKEFEGWGKDISGAKRLEDLPKEARIYLKFIEQQLKVPIKLVSVGAERESNIIL